MKKKKNQTFKSQPMRGCWLKQKGMEKRKKGKKNKNNGTPKLDTL